MSFYEIMGFALSIATFTFIALVTHGFTSNSKFATTAVIVYMVITMSVFVIGIWKIIFKI